MDFRPRSSLFWRRSLAAALGLAAAVLVLAAGAAPALADTTIGNSTPGGFTVCGGAIDAADSGYTVPAGGGVITSLSSSAFDPIGQFDLQVLRPNADGSFTVVGHTGLHSQTTGGVETFPVNIPVSGGEVLGLFYNGGGSGFSCGYGVTGDTTFVESPASSDPPVGGSFQPTASGNGSVDVSANLVTENDNTQGQNNSQGQNNH